MAAGYITEIDVPGFGNEQVSIKPDAFDDMLSAHGAEFVHYRAMRCPQGLTELYASRASHEDHAGCSNGFIYKSVGKVSCTFGSSGSHDDKRPVGVVDGSTAIVTVSRFYKDTNTQVHLANFDRLYLSEESISVINWELFQAHQTGIDKLHFPVEFVEHIMDAHGQEYRPDVDFTVRDGNIVWGRRRPGVQPDGSGVICTARYGYRPYWYVSRIIHESRFVKVPDHMTGERKLVRMPYECELQREYFFENQDNNDQVDARKTRAPASGSFGPR